MQPPASRSTCAHGSDEGAQPFASAAASTQAPLQRTKPALHVKVHAPAAHAGAALATLVVQAVEEVTDRQPFASAAHVCSDTPLHVTPVAAQVLSHTHEAVPTVPEHV